MVYLGMREIGRERKVVGLSARVGVSREIRSKMIVG